MVQMFGVGDIELSRQKWVSGYWR